MQLSTRLSRSRDYLVICLLNLLAWGLIAHGWRDPRLAAVRIEPAPTATPGPTATPVRLVIYVSGAVATPGVVRLPEGARAADAVSAAGGLAAAADPVAVNLAAPLADGEQLFVPERGAPPAGALHGVGGGSPASAARASAAAGGAGGVGAAPSRRSPASGGLGAPAGRSGAVSTDGVNVNAATADELETLPGIGPALAARIIAHREAHGPFQTAEGLLQVSGIGPKTLERFKTKVVVR